MKKDDSGRGRPSGRIDYADYRFSARELARYLLTGTALGLFAVWICYRSVFFLPAAAVVAAVYLKEKRRLLVRERRLTLQSRFGDFLSALHTAMAAGYSLENGICAASEDLERLYGPEDVLCLELAEIERQMQFRKPAEQLLCDLGRRSHVEDIRYFGEILKIAKRTGGSMAELLQSTWRSLCAKIDTAREIESMTAARRYEHSVMSVMPAAIVLYMSLTFDGFAEKMYGNPAGILLMTACLGVYLAAFFLGRKMTEGEEL